jgi:hypothetical protein
MKTQPMTAKRSTASYEIPLPPAVEIIFKAIDILKQQNPTRVFAPSGPFAASIGEIVAAEAFGLKLLPQAHKKHGATDENGKFVHIKLANDESVDLSGLCDRLIVLRILNPSTAEVVYDGCGKSPWTQAGKTRKDGTRGITLKKLQASGKSK